MPPIPQIGETEISGIFVGVIVALIIGGFWTFVAWCKRKKELRATLYSPLWRSCYNLLLLFDKIGEYERDETRGRELFNSAVRPLNDIMYNYGTAVHLKEKHSIFFRVNRIIDLKRKLKKSEEDYLSTFFRVKRTVDLNQKTVDNSNWADAEICFKNAKIKTYTGHDDTLTNLITEFERLYKDLKDLKEFCERKDKSLKGERYLFSWDNIPGADDEKLKEFLKDDFDLNWVEVAKTSKKGANSRSVTLEDIKKNKVEIKMDEKKEQAVLKICDGGPIDLNVKNEKGKLNIYGDRIYEWK